MGLFLRPPIRLRSAEDRSRIASSTFCEHDRLSTFGPPGAVERRHRPDRRAMDVEDAVRAHGGVVPSATLVRAGTKAHVIEKAVAAGRLKRVRRRWVAVPDADRLLIWAATAGVVLSCMTQARRLGLWTLDQGIGIHVAAQAHAGHIRRWQDTTVHWAQPLIQRAPGALIDPVENVLALVATRQPYEAALAVWESARRKELYDPRALARLPLASAAQTLLTAAQPYSDSGLETIVVTRLRWLKVSIRPQAWILGHRVDFLIGDRLVLQVDGGTHVGPQRTADIEHDAVQMLHGYHVIRVGYDQIINDWPSVQDAVLRAVAQGLHLAA